MLYFMVNDVVVNSMLVIIETLVKDKSQQYKIPDIPKHFIPNTKTNKNICLSSLKNFSNVVYIQ